MRFRSYFLADTAALSLGVVLGTALFVVPSGSARAVTCTQVTHTTTAGVLTNVAGEPGNPESGATATLVRGGIELALPTQPSKAIWLQALPAGTKLSSVRNLALATRQLVPGSVSLPSYQLQLNPKKTGAPSFLTLVYEPYTNGHSIALNDTQTWSALDGQTKWWATRDVTLNGVPLPRQSTAPWAAFLAEFPDAEVLAWGWNVGSGAPGTRAQLRGIRFGTTSSCEVHSWTRPIASQSPTATSSPSTTGSPSATSTPSATSSPSRTPTLTPTPTSSTTGAGVAGEPFVPPPADDLPVTGSSGPLRVFVAGLAVFATGVAAVAFARRRKSRH